MSNQRKLNAILFELQTAQSPLAQAKIIARAWRTVRELSPTDRKLLARHAGFDGAEEILEGLATHRGGFAPAMLLQMLSKARASDGQSVAQLVSALRDPDRRQETLARGLEMASELLIKPEAAEDEEPEEEAPRELEAAADAGVETPEEALAALNELDASRQEAKAARRPEGQPSVAPHAAPAAVADRQTDSSPRPEPVRPNAPPPAIAPPPPRPLPPARSKAVDWERWDLGGDLPPSTADYSVDAPRPSRTAGPRRFDAKTVMGVLGAEASVFSQLRVLHRELAGFAGSSVETLGELVEGFPDGWARRRALSALIRAGIPTDARDAVLLVATLESQRDRSWCLGALARRGDLRGAVLRYALELLGSPLAQLRIERAAEAGVATTRPSGPTTNQPIVP